MPGNNLIRRAIKRFQRRGAGDVLDRLLAGTLGRVMQPITHRCTMPSLREFYTAPGTVTVSSDEAFDHIALAIARERPPHLAVEFGKVRAELEAAYGQLSALAFADKREYSLGEASSMVLYGLVRMLRPTTALETGVANGHSTFIILKALEHNDHGTLHSFDVRSQVGGLLTNVSKDRWRFHASSEKQAPRREFANLVSRIPPIDLFLHDSDHSYANQLCEYRSVLPRLAPGAVFVSDDVDKSRAFLDFARDVGVEPVYLVDRWKVLGVIHTMTDRTVAGHRPVPKTQPGS